MQVAKAGRARVDPALTAQPLDDRAASYAPLYLTSGLGSLSFDIEDLQDLALSRLRLLKAAGDSNTPSAAAVTESSGDTLRRAEREHGFHIPPVGNADRDEIIVRDEAAHFLARLALCKNHDHRQWFLSRECALFATRLERAGADYALEKIQAADGPDIRPVPSDVLQAILPDLEAVARGVRKAASDAGTRYYQVAFEHVSSLVRTRRVLVRGGLAYVPDRHVRDVVAAQFRSKLNHALITASKAVGLAEQDPRMRTILEAVRAHHAAEETGRVDFEDGRGADRISLNQLVDALPAMPLCQLHLMNRLREDHHLRHGGRMQLGVFLKGCGLTVDESLRFWKAEFGRGGIQSDKFDKNYAYNIRHQYGKEGKRRNLQPFACIRIINERPGPGEHHGCPFREFAHHRLQDTLRRIGAPQAAVGSIVASAKDGNFQAACGLCFAATQPGHHEVSESGTPVYFPSHPNEYFIEARQRRAAPAPDDVADEAAAAAAAAAAADGEAGEDMPLLHTAPAETPDKCGGDRDAAMDTPPAKRAKTDTPGADVAAVAGNVGATADGSAAGEDADAMAVETAPLATGEGEKQAAPAGEAGASAEANEMAVAAASVRAATGETPAAPPAEGAEPAERGAAADAPTGQPPSDPGRTHRKE
jgi:DNA primase large subunit